MKNYRNIFRERMKEKLKEEVLSSIKEHLKEKERSIAELCRLTGMKRSTLIYYLNILQKQGYIKRKRIKEKLTGRPTIIRINKPMIKEDNKEFKKKTDKLNIEKIEALKFIEKSNKKKGDILSKYCKDKSPAIFFILESLGLIEEKINLTPEGGIFLKENTRKST